MGKPLSENPGHIQCLCSWLNLGTPRNELCQVFGGFHHKMWRLETDRGSYAIKQLSADTNVGKAEVVEHYNATEAVAEIFSSRGIPALHALGYGTNYLQLIDGVGYLVYPWTDAHAIDVGEITEQHTNEIARILARMHRVDIAATQLRDVPFDTHSEEKIEQLVQMARECNARKADELHQNLPFFMKIAEAQRAATVILATHTVVTHGDLDHKNVLWDSSMNPVVIDWESSRKLNPTHEVLLEALDWSGITTHFNHSLFEKFILSYAEVGGIIENKFIQASFDCIVGDWLNWLMYNVGRSLDFDDGEQRILGAAQVDLALATVLRLVDLTPTLASMVRAQSLAVDG